MIAKEEKKIDLSIPRRKYYRDAFNSKFCPECGSELIEENCTILLFAGTGSDMGEFMTNLSGSHFCNICQVVVFDKHKVKQAAQLGVRSGKHINYEIMGIVNLDSIPDDKKSLELGTDENPIPLVKFLPDQKIKTLPPPPKKTGRNEPCECGSGKKYKKCCGKV